MGFCYSFKLNLGSINEMMVTDTVIVMQLPWSLNDSDQLFKKILIGFLLAFIIVAIPVTISSLPELTRADKERLPPQLARVVLTQQEVQPKPVVEPPKVQTKVDDEVKPQKSPEITKPAVEKTPVKPSVRMESAATARARDTAKKSGLLAVANELNELTDTRDIDASVRGTVSENKKNTEAARYDASLIASAKPTSAINKVDEAKIVGDINKTDLEERKVSSQATAATERKENDKSATALGGGRAAEDVAVVFNKNKTSLYSLYDRERRKNAGLKGRIVFQLTIAPNGKVTDVKIISSDLKNPTLEARIISRIKMFIFSPSSGESTVINYPVEFLP